MKLTIAQNRTIKASASVVLFLALALASAANAQPVDNGPFSTTGSAKNITAFAIADDFTVTAPGPFNSIRFWAVDGNSTLSSFSGTISWFVHENGPGNLPGVVVASGVSSNVLVTNTGQELTGTPIFQLDFNTPTTTLTQNQTYWLRLKENGPTDPDMGSPIFWLERDGQTGNTYRADSNEVNPTTWTNDGDTTTDLAFELNRASVNVPGAAAPEPGTLALIGTLLGGLAVRRRRK